MHSDEIPFILGEAAAGAIEAATQAFETLQ
jgi:hypothetical protein